MKLRFFIFLTSLMCLNLLFMNILQAGDRSSGTEKQANEKIEDKWGIEVTAIRLAGAGYFVDFRFKVTVPDRAQNILNRQEQAALADLATGKVMPVTRSKIGPLRSTAVNPETGRQYTVLFNNVGRTIQRGSLVVVSIGKFLSEPLTVE